MRDNRGMGRFEAEVDGELAVVEYRLGDEVIILTHTEVPEALEGKGVGSRLVGSVMAHIRERGMKIAPICPFVTSWLRRHPEHHDLVHANFRYMMG